MTGKKRQRQSYKVGDPDPTPTRGQLCGALNRRQLACTRRPGHEMPHVAGGGEVILAVWYD